MHRLQLRPFRWIFADAAEGNFARRRYLPTILAFATLLLSLSITFGAWYNAHRSEQRNIQTEFDFQVHEVVNRIARRMGTYEQVLRGAKGFLDGSIKVERSGFRAYVDALDLNKHFPGIQGIGISEIIPADRKERHIASIRREGFPAYVIWPAGEREFYTSITKIEPFNSMNQRAFGYDMFSHPVRRIAMARARDTGNAALSGKVTLVQEGKTDVQAGVLLYQPVYRLGIPLDTVEQRRAAILGWVYAPFRIGDFMHGLEGVRSGDFEMTVYDGASVSPQACLYGCSGSGPERHFLEQFSRVGMAGHTWTVVVRSTHAFEQRTSGMTPKLIAGGGVVTSLLLAALVWILGSSRNRAMSLAWQMTRELRTSHGRIAAEQQRLQVILENSYDAFVAVDTEGKITDWSMQAERTFGWSASEAVGKDLAQVLIPEDQRKAHSAGFKRFIVSGAGPLLGKRVEVLALHRSGKRIFVELALAAIKTDSGYAAAAFIRDLTERKENERREAERQRALEQASQALQNAQRLESVGKLTGGVAHDFNNVLQIISGNIQLLLYGMRNGEQHERRLRSIMEAVDRGSKLSSQLLAFARRQPLQPQAVNLRQLLANIDDLLLRALGEEIDIDIVGSDGLWNTLVDPNQLENVILNLAINARDAMQGNGKLTIELDNVTLDEDYVRPISDLKPGQYVMLAVSDTGTGMTPEVLANAFEPFFTTKPEGQGTGLGLSMAYGVVKQSGGHIQIYSEVGHGTTVRIYLPRSTDDEHETPDKNANQTVAGGKETILVVEDDPGVQESVVAMLSGLGYEVLSANDGEAALDVIRSGKPIDVLFTDVVMPGSVRSTDMAKEARNLQPHIAVLYTSGYTQNAIVHAGRLDPGVHLLSKPYRREQLAVKVRQVIDLHKSQHAC